MDARRPRGWEGSCVLGAGPLSLGLSDLSQGRMSPSVSITLHVGVCARVFKLGKSLQFAGGFPQRPVDGKASAIGRSDWKSGGHSGRSLLSVRAQRSCCLTPFKHSCVLLTGLSKFLVRVSGMNLGIQVI